LFSVFDGDGITQEKHIEIAVPELNDRLSDRFREGDIVSSRFPEWPLACQKRRINSYGEDVG